MHYADAMRRSKEKTAVRLVISDVSANVDIVIVDNNHWPIIIGNYLPGSRDAKDKEWRGLCDWMPAEWVNVDEIKKS